jgi:hypothetical protein
VGGKFAHAHCVNGHPHNGGSGGGRREDERDVLVDERDVLVTDQEGTASRPLRVRHGQSPLIERVNHVPHGVLIRNDQSAIAETGVPEAEARIMVARRTRIDFRVRGARSASVVVPRVRIIGVL